MDIPTKFFIGGLKKVKCNACEEYDKDCFYVSYSCWSDGDSFNICMDCIKKELDNAVK